MRILLVLLWVFSSVAWGAPTAGAPDTGAMDELLRTFENAAGQWPAIIIPITTYLFWTLVTISWAWSFGMMVLNGGDTKDIVAELCKRTIMVGFFFYLLLNAHELGAIIINSFASIGAKLAGSGAAQTAISPSSVFDIGLSLVSKMMSKLHGFDIASSIGYILVSLGILVIFAFIVLNLMVVIIQYYFLLNAGVVMLGFLGHEWSRDYGINYFKLMIGIGVKYLTMQLIIVLTLNIIDTWVKQSELTWTQLLIILPMMIVIWGLVREIPQMAQSLVSGSDQTTGNAVAGAMQAAALTAAAAAGAYGAMGGATGMLQGAGNMSRLAGAAWDAASEGGGEGGEGGDGGGENDPATSTPPESGSGSGDSSAAGSGAGDSSADAAGSDAGDSGAASSSPGSGEQGASGEASSGDSAGDTPPKEGANKDNGAKRGFLGTAAVAAGIAGGAIGKQMKGSAANAFKSAMTAFNTPSDSVVGRAAASLKPNDPSLQPQKKNPMNDAGKSGASKPEPWMQQSGGFSKLSKPNQQQALKNFSQWINDPKHTFNLEEYVSYTQGKNQK